MRAAAAGLTRRGLAPHHHRLSSSYARAIAAATPDAVAAGADEAWPVVVVGGGPTGALLAGLLARAAVPTLLLEKGTGPAAAGGGPTGGGGHPAAHFITARSMEALRRLPAAFSRGSTVADAVAAASPPLPQWRRFVYGPSAAAASPWAAVDHFAAAAPDPATPAPPVDPASSPEPVAHLAQPRLVAALHAAASAAGAELRYRCEVGGGGGGGGRGGRGHGHRPALSALPPACAHPSGPGALLTYRCGGPGAAAAATTRTVAARFVVAADGARSVLRSGSGVAMDGPAAVAHLVSIHFRSVRGGHALLRSGSPAMLYFFFNPSAAGALVAHDLGRGEFVAQVPVYPPLQSGSSLARDRAACKALARAALGVADADVAVLDARPWTMSARTAAEYAPAFPPSGLPPRSALILAGDAAHEMPPAGGFGMNTGLQDAGCLAPKLAAVLAGQAHPRLVTGCYGAERGPVAAALAALSLSNWRAALAVPRAVGADDRAADGLAALASGVAALVGGRAAGAALDAGLAAGRALTTSLGGAAGDAWRASRARAALARPGAGLRLLFEGADLGHQYWAGHGAAVAAAGRGGGARGGAPPPHPPPPPFTDAATYTPILVAGARLPAAAVRAVRGGGGGAAGAAIASTVDAPAALATTSALPPAVLLIDGGAAGAAGVAAWASAAAALRAAGAPLATAVVAGGHGKAAADVDGALVLGDDPAAPPRAAWAAVAARAAASAGIPRPPALLVRPDGVIAWVPGAGEAGGGGIQAGLARALGASLGWGDEGGGGPPRPAWLPPL